MRHPLLLVLLLTACPVEPESPPAVAPTGDGLFAEGCPAPGGALARVIGVDSYLPGRAAVGTAGDLLLANERAAFVITDAVGQSTYWYYGGALADAVPMDGCAPGEDKLDELGFVFASPDLFAFEQSLLRAFRADTVEVLRDGSDGGAAVVRATGTDAIHWLVEHTLIKEAATRGGRPVSQPFGTQIVVDYILEPDSAVLRIDVEVRNTGESSFGLVDAALFQYGETLSEYAFSSNRVDLGGLGLDAGLPWLLASDGAGAYAFGTEDGNLSTVRFSGVQVGIDLNQLGEGFSLAPGRSETLTRLLAVGDGDGSGAIEALLEANPRPLRDQTATVGTIEGTVSDAAGPAADVTVRVEGKTPDAEWGTLYAANAPGGAFRVVVPDFEEDWEFRLVAQGPGRDPGEAVAVTPGQNAVALSVGLPGAVTFDFTSAGEPSPGHLVLRREDGQVRRFWLKGAGSVPVPPGSWSYTVTRGYEFGAVTGDLDIAAGGEAPLSAELVRVVDTTGWVSVDTHVHSSDSPDSNVNPADRLIQAAAHGLDVVIHTEHENIVDRRAVPAEAGVAQDVIGVIGEEVTSVAVEHMTMFPAEPTDAPRGGYVEWYGLDIDQLFADMRARSEGGVNLLNHPSWLGDIQWDRINAEPGLDDPTLLGFEPDAPLWSWNLDGIEVMNGHGNPFADGNGRWDDWMSMVNAGHQLMAVGCSDAHGVGGVGFPRTYARAPSDAPAELDVPALVASFQGGQAVVSAGAFAEVSIAGVGPGEQVTDTDGSVDLAVRIQALPAIDVTHLVAFVNCDQQASVLATDADGVVKFDGTLTLPADGDSHVVLAAFGANPLPDGLPQYNGARTPRVLTNPIYVDGDGDGLFSAPGGRQCTYSLGVDQAR